MGRALVAFVVACASESTTEEEAICTEYDPGEGAHFCATVEYCERVSEHMLARLLEHA